MTASDTIYWAAAPPYITIWSFCVSENFTTSVTAQFHYGKCAADLRQCFYQGKIAFRQSYVHEFGHASREDRCNGHSSSLL